MNMAFRNIFQVANLLRVNPETVRRWIREGKLEAYRAGRKQLISDEALEKFLRPVQTGVEH